MYNKKIPNKKELIERFIAAKKKSPEKGIEKPKLHKKLEKQVIKEIEAMIKDKTKPNIQIRKRDLVKGKFNPWYHNNELSMQAHGLMNYLWNKVGYTNKLKFKFLCLSFKNSEEEIKKTIDELIERGYLKIYKLPTKGLRFDLFRSQFITKENNTSKDFF